jgi:hypothetical protein
MIARTKNKDVIYFQVPTPYLFVEYGGDTLEASQGDYLVFIADEIRLYSEAEFEETFAPREEVKKRIDECPTCGEKL